MCWFLPYINMDQRYMYVPFPLKFHFISTNVASHCCFRQCGFSMLLYVFLHSSSDLHFSCEMPFLINFFLFVIMVKKWKIVNSQHCSMKLKKKSYKDGVPRFHFYLLGRSYYTLSNVVKKKIEDNVMVLIYFYFTIVLLF